MITLFFLIAIKKYNFVGNHYHFIVNRLQHIGKSIIIDKRRDSIDKDEQEIESIKTGIPILERCIRKYHEMSIEAKNEILRSLIEKIEYNKSERGKSFQLKIYMKI